MKRKPFRDTQIRRGAASDFHDALQEDRDDKDGQDGGEAEKVRPGFWDSQDVARSPAGGRERAERKGVDDDGVPHTH